MSKKKALSPPVELVFDEITRRAAAINLPVSQLFERIGKKADTFQRWKGKNPKSIETYKQLDAELVKEEKKANLKGA